MLSEAEILQFINEDKVSTKKSLAKIGQKYYEAEHDILQYRVFYYNADGKLVEDTTRSNIKIPHPFFTELVDQEVQYMLSGKDGFIKTDVPELQDRLDEYFDDDFNSELNDVLTGAVSKGFDYMYAYMNSEGRLAFQHADSMGVVEVRAKDTGDTVTVPAFNYIGDADDVAEGASVTASQLTASSTTFGIKKAMKAVSLTDEAVLSGYGNPVGEATTQLAKAIASKVDSDAMDALTVAYNASIGI